MMSVLDWRADQILFQKVIIFIIMFFAVVIESVLGVVPALYGSVPKISFCVLFLVALHKPQGATPYNMALVGLVFDMLQGNPFGYTSSIFLLILGVVSWRRVFLDFADVSVLWSEFVLMLLGLMFYIMVIFGLYHGVWPPFAEVLFQIGFTALIFPIFNWGYLFSRQLGLFLGGER